MLMADGINRKKTENIKSIKAVKRGKGGLFAKGTKGGPGRPPRQTETQYLDRLRENVTLDDWDEIINAMKTAAKRGDVQAFNALCKWCMPKQANEDQVDRDDPDPEGLA